MDPKQGGPCQGIRNSIPAQEKLGVINEVLTLDDPASAFLKQDNFIINAIGPSNGPYSYCSGLKDWLKNNLERFDLIIIHGLWQYHSYTTYKIWRELKRKSRKAPSIYVMPHGMLDPYFQRAKSRRLKAIRNWIFWKLVEGNVLNKTSGVLFTCEEELLLARQTFSPYNPRLELNVGYGIQPPPYFKHIHSADFLDSCSGLDHKNYWLFLSRIHPKKGVDMLINAYTQLEQENPHLPSLVIAGPGMETAYGKYLRKLAEGKKIYFPGMLEGNSKWGAFYGCNAFILPSHQENFGIALVEAMGCKKPVLITNKVNIWREIDEGNGGLICDDTVSGVKNMLQKWLNFSSDKKLKYGENSYKIYQSNFEIEHASYKMIEAFKNNYNYERTVIN